MAKVKIWLKRPELFYIALVTWLMTLLTIITPATITVQLGIVTESRQLDLPRIDFTSNHFQTDGGKLGTDRYGQSADLVRLSNNVAYGGHIMQPLAPGSASSSQYLTYDIEFSGPALACRDATPSQYTDFYLAYMSPEHTNSRLFQGSYSYAAWVPTVDSATNQLSGVPQFNASVPTGVALTSVVDSMLIYQATNLVNGSYILLHCNLRNATYSAKFNFSSDAAEKLIINHVGQHSNLQAVEEFPLFTHGFGQQLWGYFSTMAVFSRFILGTIKTDKYGAPTSTTAINSTEVYTTFRRAEHPTSETLGSSLEQLFSNITVSLFSDSQFLNTSSTDDVISEVRMGEIYIFRAWEAYIAYGLAVLCSSAAMVSGTLAIRKNRCVYSNNLSTVLRMHKDPELIMAFSTDATGGAEPLPKKLKKLQVICRAVKQGASQDSGLRLAADADIELSAIVRKRPRPDAAQTW